MGKLLCGIFGLIAGGFPGLILGVFIGYFFDKALSNMAFIGSGKNLEEIRQSFFDTSFILAGHIAKSDGRISPQEIAHTEALFVELNLNKEQRAAAIALFKQGSADGLDLEAVVAAFTATCGRNIQLVQTLLVFLISLAKADGQMASQERSELVRIAGLLGIGAAQFSQILSMVQAQANFQYSHQHAGGGSYQYTGGNAGGAADSALHVAHAYAALGINESVSDSELKRAYRKLMSQNHPDKLIAKGVPENMIKLATERSQEIQSAYETIRKDRGIGK